MRRLLAIVLLVFLPLQFSWAAVATYCGHETRAGAGHFGHHEHQHQADAGDKGDKTPGAMDLDCGHCHGHCSVMVTLPSASPGALSAAPPGAAVDEDGGAHSPPRPERPQWRLLA